MAFAQFYLVAGGAGASNINAGSSTGAAQATTTNGNWNATTGVFIAASGTPFASTVVGDYASVYVDGATVTTFVAKVTTVTSNVNITIDVASIKYGTAPSTSATARSCTINGAWTSEIVLAAGGLAGTTVPQSTKINITGNLTITANRTVSMAGATTTPLWFSGYTTTPGDLDTDTSNSLAKPIWTCAAGQALTSSGVHQVWSGLSVVGNRSGVVWSFSTAGRMVRCRVENTSSNAAAYACLADASGLLAYCWFKAPATGTTNAVCWQNSGCVVIGCVAEGGGLSGFNASAQAVWYQSCVALNNPVGFLASTGAMRVLNCTVYNASGDGVKWTGTPGAQSVVTSVLFNVCGGYGINNASGVNTNNVFRACNDFYSCTSNPENGFGDSPAFFQQIDAGTGAPGMVTSATDMTPISTSNARNNGFPGKFENQSFINYLDVGAVDHVDPAAGGILRNPGLSGGLI